MAVVITLKYQQCVYMASSMEFTISTITQNNTTNLSYILLMSIFKLKTTSLLVLVLPQELVNKANLYAPATN